MDILILFIILSGVEKVGGTLLVDLLYHKPVYDVVTFVLLMNTKGIIEIIVLNVGKY